MQHEDPIPEPGAIAPSPLEHSVVVLRALWPCMGSKERRTLRRCCANMRDAVDAQAGSVEGQAESPVLSAATCDRLVGIHTLTLRSMACLRGMLLDAPGAVFPRPVSAPAPGGCARPHHRAMRSTRAHTPCVPCVPCLIRYEWPAAMQSAQSAHGCMDGRPLHALDGMRPPGPPLVLPPPSPLSNTPCMLIPNAGCDRASRRLRGHRHHRSPSHPPQPAASSQRHRSAPGDGSAALCVQQPGGFGHAFI
jgi:hypothetical protein